MGIEMGVEMGIFNSNCGHYPIRRYPIQSDGIPSMGLLLRME